MIVLACITVSSALAYDENYFDGKTKKSLRASLPSTTRSISRDLQVFLFKRGRKECIQREKNLIPELFKGRWTAYV